MTLNDEALKAALIDWLRKRGEPDSGIRYEARSFDGRGARELADALASLPAVGGEPGAFVDLPTLKWWRELVDLNPADLAPRLDDRIRNAAPPTKATP